MLIPFPLGLLATAVVFDIVYLSTDKPGFVLASAYAMAKFTRRNAVPSR